MAAVFSLSVPPHLPPPSSSSSIRRPQIHQPTTASPSPSPSAPPPPPPTPKLPTNPLKPFSFPSSRPDSSPLSNKLRLSSKLNPPPPAPPQLPLPAASLPPTPPSSDDECEDRPDGPPGNSDVVAEFRQPGKIFVGNLPNWVKKHEVAEFFRQFGPINSVILIRGYKDGTRNAGFGFVIYDGETAERSAMNAVEFDGIEFHGRVLTVKLDDGKRLKEKAEDRARFVRGDGKEAGGRSRSKWHEEREGSRGEFRRVLETAPENWQAVVTAFEKIPKPSRREFGLMVNYYARRGDMHRARESFERMRARGIEPTSHVFTK